MEQNFGERLKNYRRAKNMTQQELADMLGVSNKTVSRWESGGYPDLGMLVPLARALGVTVDDLLDGEKPIRTLTQADWQNFLSFAFALGGGVLFFLLDLFMPVVLCYLAYLMCMIYGVYLQRHYCYQTQWFRIANGVMNLSVNLSMAYRCLTGLSALGMYVASSSSLARKLPESLGVLLTKLIYWYMNGLLWVGFAVALIATAVTLYLVEKKNLSVPAPRELYLRRPGVKELLPTLCAMVLGGFWMVFGSTTLPRELYVKQDTVYQILLWGAFLVCFLLALRRKGKGLLSALALAAGGLILPDFGQVMVYIPYTKEFRVATKVYLHRAAQAPGAYQLHTAGDSSTLLATAVIAALCAALAFVGLRVKKAPAKTDSDPDT